ncbi:MAG: F0F1 ATP synthase subunit A [candidate division WOR-3 bacterium]
MKNIHISIAAEELFRIGPLPITNSLLVTYLTILLFIIIIALIRVKKNIIPVGIQNVVEYIMEYFYNLVCEVFGSEERGRKFFPLVMTIFLFVLIINWFGLLPGVGSIGFYRESPVHAEQIEQKGNTGEESHSPEIKEHKEFVPLFRGASADLNTTLALALISVIFTQIYSIQILGFKGFLKRFIKLKNPIMFFVGILELIAEIAKIISFSFRLFGNIFAGEVLLTVMLFLLPLAIPVPFLALEIFVGIIQAIIFSFLTLFFIKIATTEEEH